MTPSDRPSERVRVAAYEWHLKMQEGRMSAEELHRLEQWLASEPSHRAAYERAGDLWYELGGLDPDCIPETARRPLLRERLLDWAQAGLQRWIMRATFAAMATSAALFVAVQLNGTGWMSDSTATGIAETRVLTLSDGSVVALSPRTEVSVDYDGSVRLVQVAEGEAFFDVKRDPERPFRVQAGSSELTVVGTAFNVRHIEDSVSLAVSEGTVRIAASAAAETGRTLDLGAGERVSVDPDGTLGEKSTVDPADIAAWRRQRLVYVGAPLSEVVADANRYASTWFFLGDDGAAEVRITASFDTSDIDGMFETIEQALPVSVWRPVGGLAIIQSR